MAKGRKVTPCWGFGIRGKGNFSRALMLPHSSRQATPTRQGRVRVLQGKIRHRMGAA